MAASGPEPVHGVLLRQGAEARVYRTTLAGRPVVVKERFRKGYRHPTLDAKLTAKRTQQEARAIHRCRTAGIPAPALLHVDLDLARIVMEDVAEADTVRDFLRARNTVAAAASSDKNDSEVKSLMASMGSAIAAMHAIDVIHGDLTTSNMLRRTDTGVLVVIDFGLSSVSNAVEDKAVDLYVLERAFLSTHPGAAVLFEAVLETYVASWQGATAVMKHLEEVRGRGRKRDMIG